MRITKKLAVAVSGLVFAGAAVPTVAATASVGRPSASVASHHVVAGYWTDGCDSWGDCWDTWSNGGGWW